MTRDADYPERHSAAYGGGHAVYDPSAREYDDGEGEDEDTQGVSRDADVERLKQLQQVGGWGLGDGGWGLGFEVCLFV